MTITERHLNTIAVALEQLPQLHARCDTLEDEGEWQSADAVHELIEGHRYDALLALARLTAGHFNVVPQERLSKLATDIIVALGEEHG